MQTVLVLGANGRFGRTAAAAFAAAGWEVRRFDRATDTLTQAAQGVDVIVNAWNPPYTDWARQVPVLHQQVIDAARHSGACVIVPGNVYVFGAQTPAPWSADTPHGADNPLGQIRVRMEMMYRDADVRTIILRAGDFLDTRASGNWFDKVMIPSLPKGRLTYPGNPDIPHAWAYLPDLCAAAVQLAEIRAQLPRFLDLPFAGYTLTGREMAALISDVIAAPVTVKQMSWLPLRLAAPVWGMGRCLLEMRYLWNTPHWLDDSAFTALLPDFRATPPQQALSQAVQGAGAIRSTQTSR